MIGFELFLVRQGLSQRTVQQHLYRTAILKSECSPFTQENVELFLVGLIKKAASGSCVNKYIQAAKKYCEFEQLAWGENLKKVREEAKTKKLFSIEEVEAFISLGGQLTKYSVYWSCVAMVGARLGEIASLSVADVDFAQNVFYFDRTKTGVGRTVPIPDRLMEILKKYTSTLKTDLLFPTKNNNSQPVQPAAYTKDFRRRLEILGIKKKVTPYSLRHSFLNRVLDEGADLFAVKNIAGWKRIETAANYRQTGLKRMKKAMETDPLGDEYLEAQVILNKIIGEVRHYKQRYSKKLQFYLSEKEDSLQITISIK